MATYRKLPSGKIQVQIRIQGHKSLSRSFRTRKMAQDWARTKEDEIARGIYMDTSTAERTTVGQVLARYEKDITPRKKSAVKEVSRIKILSAFFGDVMMAGLRAESMIDYVDERLDAVVADTVRKELQTLSHAVDTAMALWNIHLPANPVKVARDILKVTQTLKPGAQRERRPSPAELDRLLRSQHGAMWKFFIETAMRRGEVANAKRSDRSGDLLKIPDTKTGKARTIPLSRRAVEILDSLPARMDGSLFGMRPDSITQAFRRECAEVLSAGGQVQEPAIVDLRVHDLRHEATCRLFEKGLQIQEVAVITGHTDWKSLKRYTHLQPEQVGRKLG